MMLIPGEREQHSVRIHHTTQNGAQCEALELIIAWLLPYDTCEPQLMIGN